MRFRVKCRGKGAPRRPAAPAAAPASPAPPRAAELENPYGRYYGRARSREELKKP
mgnify:CR=1 FL=1